MATTLHYVPETLDLHTNTNHSENSITNIVGEVLPSHEKTEFCYQIAKRTLKALLAHHYSDFDAQTTSNCCHGMSLLVRELICLSNHEDLQELLDAIEKRIEENKIVSDFTLPKPLIELCQLYILAYVRTICLKGIRTSAIKLKSISPLGNSFFQNLVKMLQRDFSNKIAFQYEHYLYEIGDFIKTCGVSIRLWGKYVSPSYLRISSQNIYFASCLFSMQVSLAHLISSKAKIAVVNDIYDSKDRLIKRYVKILKGNGMDGFEPMHFRPDDHPTSFFDEPMIVFGGCSYNEDPDFVSSQMEEWIYRFPNLVLACDTFYPQFPKIDLYFNKDPIVPEEKILQKAIDHHKELNGVSASNPTLFCLNHVYPASLKQILWNEIPAYKIPKILLESAPMPSK